MPTHALYCYYKRQFGILSVKKSVNQLCKFRLRCICNQLTNGKWCYSKLNNMNALSYLAVVSHDRLWFVRIRSRAVPQNWLIHTDHAHANCHTDITRMTVNWLWHVWQFTDFDLHPAELTIECLLSGESRDTRPI